MVKKIVIHGASGLKNSGDEAILQAIIQQCPTEWQITVISFDPVYTQKIHPSVTVVKMGDSGCLRAIEQCDGFILGGGGLIQDETSVYNVSRWLKYLKYAIKMGKPTFLYANSIGPLHFGFNRWMAKSVLKKVDGITLRDEISYKELERLHVADKAIVTADPVFSLKVPESDMWDLNQYGLGGKEYVAICVRHWFDTIPWLPVSICTKFRLRRKKDILRYKNYIKTMADLTKQLIKEGKAPVFVPFMNGRDTVVARDICRLANISDDCVLNLEDASPNEVLQIIKGAALVIGMRLHSIIYAIIAGTPVVAIDYSQKVAGMIEYLGLSEYSINVNLMNGEELCALTSRTLSQAERQKVMMLKKLTLIRKNEYQNIQLFHKVIKKRKGD